jgi:glycosyltransferase involved in cell wall biosynthesis
MSRKYPGNFEVILSANVSHYYYAALALQQANSLKRYICAISIRKEKPLFAHFLPDYWQKKLKGRNISDIDKRLTRSIWVAELLQRGLPYLGLISSDRGNLLNNYLFDLLAQRWVESCDIFHFVSSIGLHSARKAKANGSLVVCDVRTEYPDCQFQLLAEEYNNLGLSYNPPGLLYDERIKAEYGLADYLIVPSNYAKRTFVEAGFDPKSVFVLPYGVDLEHFLISDSKGERKDADETGGRHRNTFRIIYVGQIVPRKGVHYLIEAFNKLKINDAELLLVGGIDQSMHPILEEAVRRNRKIRAVGESPRLDLYHLYNTGSVFVLPSLADSWGLVVLEAMACGLPVIVTENTGSSQAVEEGVNGFIVPIRDAEALHRKLIYLYEHPDVRQEMGRAASCSARKFTWEQYNKGLLDIYREIIRRGTGNSFYSLPLEHKDAVG